MAMADPTFHKPTFITGGCLCGSVRYEATFAEDHDFLSGSGSCQCTQCRKNTGSLFFLCQHVPNDRLKFTSKETLREYSASKDCFRGFCSGCGSFLYWRSSSGQDHELAVGSVDALYLCGDGAGEGNDVPKGGYGAALCNGGGQHGYCVNEIKGVTDDIPILLRGKRLAKDD